MNTLFFLYVCLHFMSLEQVLFDKSDFLTDSLCKYGS